MCFKWIYTDTKETIDINRPCKFCGKYPTKEGYDGCLGYLEGVKHTCCGHGTNKSYIISKNNKYIQFDDMYNLKNILKI